MSDSAAGVRMEDAFGILLRRSAVPSIAAAALCAVAAGLLRGSGSVGSALLGSAIVILFFGARLVVMRRTARANPQLVLVVALAVYTVKIVLLGLAMLLLTRVAWVDAQVLGLAVLVTAVVWLAAEMRGFVRLRIPVFAAGAGGAAPDESGAGGRRA
ncbi:ATP synthase protein I [Kineococcus xinjiangensis]|uniref:ATP synthase protein I n=1 Tax=Kineococcus xinjiangensis TaxID=512762 RepID=A0A2S6IWK4_9ACTN|nr:hypothetical protein [Kineococcus xinjiangensis]PPK98665.1 ATP synthase protein I [Kineococcus xinjiangensis]